VSRRRRAVLLFGLALALGGLAASDVARREAALERRLGRPVAVVTAREELQPGTRVTADKLAVRRVPERYAPPDALPALGELVGRRVSVPVPAGAHLSAAAFGETGEGPAGPPVAPGERVADVVAAGAAELVQPGGRVDLLVTREKGPGQPGQTSLALEDVEVLAAAPAAPGESAGNAEGATPKVRVSLRVTVRQAVFLAAAQSFSRELRVLPRAPGDRRRGAEGMTVEAGLG
jgi:pilus assembly protein CpaB